MVAHAVVVETKPAVGFVDVVSLHQISQQTVAVARQSATGTELFHCRSQFPWSLRSHLPEKPLPVVTQIWPKQRKQFDHDLFA